MRPVMMLFVACLAMLSSCMEEGKISTKFDGSGDPAEKAIIAFQKKYPHAKIESYMWRSDNPSKYMFKASESGLTRKVFIRKDGSILDDKVFKQIPREDFPAVAVSSLKKEYPGKTFVNPKRVIHNGNLEYYAVVDMNERFPAEGGKHATRHLHEVYILPDGHIRSIVPEWKGEPWATRLLQN